jgi:hypothetical protein
MTFGNPFGLALYDKQQREVSSPEARPNPGRSGPAFSSGSIRSGAGRP